MCAKDTQQDKSLMSVSFESSQGVRMNDLRELERSKIVEGLQDHVKEL